MDQRAGWTLCTHEQHTKPTVISTNARNTIMDWWVSWIHNVIIRHSRNDWLQGFACANMRQNTRTVGPPAKNLLRVYTTYVCFTCVEEHSQQVFGTCIEIHSLVWYLRCFFSYFLTAAVAALLVQHHTIYVYNNIGFCLMLHSFQSSDRSAEIRICKCMQNATENWWSATNIQHSTQRVSIHTDLFILLFLPLFTLCLSP